MTLVWSLKFAAWGLSFLGLCYLLQKAFKARCEFMPLITAATVSCAVMAFGMLGVMRWASIFIYVSGFAGAVFCAFEKIRKRARPCFGFWAAGAFILAWGALAAYILRDTFIFVYDDLSHWALVARELLLTDALPDANMKTLVFQAYPTGSACFIYYFCRFTDSREFMFTLAQSLFKGFAILPLFAYIKKNRAFGSATVAMAFLTLLMPNKFLMTLQVDSLLSFMGIGAFAIIYHYRKTPMKSVWCALPILIFFAWVKNSGLFFVFILSVFATVYCKKECGRLKSAAAFAVTFILPVAAFGAWLLRVKQLFPSGLESRHAFSISSYISHLMSSDVTLDIIKSFVKKLFNQELIDMALYALLFAIFAVYMIWSFVSKNAELRAHILKCAKWIALVYAAWLISLLAMYIFSMPEDQALRTASFVRYNRSVLVPVILAVLTLTLERVCAEDRVAPKKLKPLLIAYLVLAVAATAIYPSVTRAYFFSSTKTEARVRMIDMIKDTNAERDRRYLILCDPRPENIVDQPQSIYYLLKYEFMTDDIDLIYKTDGDEHYVCYSVKQSVEQYVPYQEVIVEPEEWLIGRMPEYDYTILFEEMPDIQDIARNAATETGAVFIDASVY